MNRIKNWLFGLFHKRTENNKEQKTTEQIFQELDDLTNSFLYKNEANLQKYFSK